MPARVTLKKIEFFQERLLEWYALFNRDYDWRMSELSPYQYIIAEVLLQRTNANTVAKFYRAFIADFPDWQSLANAELQVIEEYLRPIGLYKQRAKRLRSLAVEMVSRKGVLPTDRNELEQIPFFGQYISNAIELVVFKKRSPLIDVNMSRVLERYFGPRKLADIRHDPYLQALAKNVVDHAQFKEINWAILDFAALVCKARNPQHDSCPLKRYCAFYKKSVL